MFKWLKEKSRQKSAKNIEEILIQLINVAAEADQRIIASGGATNADDMAAVKNLQQQLYFELNGPLELDEVRAAFIDPIVSSEELSEGTKLAVTHIFDTYREKSNR